MNQLPPLKEEEATGEIAEIFADIRREMQLPFVPNFFKAQGRSPNILAGSWGAARYLLMRGTLPRALKEMIFVAVSVARGCQYCAVAHVAFCKMMGVDEETMTALIKDLDAISPQRTRDIVKFAVKCATDPVRLTDEDYEAVRRHGISELELMEIIAVSGLATYFDILADALKVEIDSSIVEVLGGQDDVARKLEIGN